MKLAVKAFREKIRYFNDLDYLVNVIAFNIAPTIKGLKAATTVTLCNKDRNMLENWKKYKIEVLNRLKVKAFELKETDRAIIVLFYKEDILKSSLESEITECYLSKFGYASNMSIDKKLKLLKERYQNNVCPHELGLFLGFPLEDVKMFIEYPNMECLICGYWKVYNDENGALKKFKDFDDAKLEIINKVCKVSPSVEILKIV